MALTTEARSDLLAALQPLVAEIAEDLRHRLVTPQTPIERAARQAAAKLHEQERVGDALDVWLDLLGHRASVMWVLKLVYARVLEDRSLIHSRILDQNHQTLFERLAPNLGETAFLRWVFTDLAQSHGGLPELFSPQPAEVLPPSDAHSRALLALFRKKNVDTDTLLFDFTGEKFDGQLLGDLYQELDPVVKARFALLQTPSFVRSFMLDRTLGEALKEWGADEIRVLDPACGSGHFLIDSLRRLVDATAKQHEDWTRQAVVQHALKRVVGIDLNDYAAALARARLLMTALELAGENSLTNASAFTPQVFWADGLEQVEKGEDTSQASQMSLLVSASEIPRAVFTPTDTRAVLRPLLKPSFHVVVANPPYITEKDKTRKKYHKENVGNPKRRRYVSAHRTYSLGSPFTERCFQLAVDGGHVGIINSNSFAKREFGVPLVEEVLANLDLRLLVDTSGAYIPGHGTPTILVFGRNRAPQGDTFTAVLGKRGEPSNPNDASKGKVWISILEGWNQDGFDSEFVSTELVQRGWFKCHPWSLRGGGALRLQHDVESMARDKLQSLMDVIGRTTHTGLDPVYYLPPHIAGRIAPRNRRAWLVRGEDVRDFRINPGEISLFPYQSDGSPFPDEMSPVEFRYYLRYRAPLKARIDFGRSIQERGMHFTEHSMFFPARYRAPLSIAFAFVATHNHFVLDRGGKVFNRTAPVIKLPADATEDDHLALLGPLNSSTACFWSKQVFFCKGYGVSGAGARTTAADWEDFWEFDSTKTARFPLPPNYEFTLPWARALDEHGHARAADTVSATLEDAGWNTAESLNIALQQRRSRDLGRLRQMVGLQEELDWLCYRLYGITGDELPVLAPDKTPPVTPGWRPFELALAQEDAAAREALAAGEVPDAPPTAWFERHGWTPCAVLPDVVPPEWAAVVAQRLEATKNSAALRLLEAPVHKRRWYNPDYEKDEKSALQTFLLNKLEDALKVSDTPQTPRALARSLASDTRFRSAAQVLTGSQAPDLETLCAGLMAGDSVAAWTRHRYTSKGLVKRRQWERTWALQHREDQGEKVTIKVPPKYTQADFIDNGAYKLRGQLDVPKERFVAHTEVPKADGDQRVGVDALYGWAGWTRTERTDKLFGLLETLEDEGVPKKELRALFDVMFRYLDELARTDETKAANLRADLTYEASQEPTEAQLKAWLASHPARGSWT